jgi:hypothetical protein
LEVLLVVMAGSFAMNLVLGLVVCICLSKGVCEQHQKVDEEAEASITMTIMRKGEEDAESNRPDPVITFPPPPKPEDDRSVMEPLPTPPPPPPGPPPTEEEEKRGGASSGARVKPPRGLVRIRGPQGEDRVGFAQP